MLLVVVAPVCEADRHRGGHLHNKCIFTTNASTFLSEPARSHSHYSHYSRSLVGLVPSATDVESQLAILRIARVLLAGAPSEAEDGVPEWVQRLIVVQASVHERMGVTGNARDLSRAEGILHTCIKARPLLLDTYVEVLTAEDRSSESLLALSAITSFAAGLPGYDGKLFGWAFNVFEANDDRVCVLHSSLATLSPKEVVDL